MSQTFLDFCATKRRAWVLAAFIVASVVILGNSDLVLGKAAPVWDAVDNYAPFFSLVADHVKAGKLMLWNPWSNGGAPDFADPQFGATSPIMMLFGGVAHDPFRGFIAYWLCFWIFGGIGMLLLCRHFDCPAWGGLIAALGFVSCGFYTGHGQHTAILYSFSFLPWIVWRFDVALARRSYGNMVQVGILWGLSALGGYPGLVILDPLFLVLWALGRAWFACNDLEDAMEGDLCQRLLFCLLGFCLIAVVGLAIMSPSYVGFLGYTKGYTFRTIALSRQRALVDGPLPPQAILTLSSPYLYLLNWPPYRIWPETDLSMSNIYSGVLVISLAVASLLRRLRWRLWLGLIAAFFLSCSVGTHLPVRGWVYTLVPPTRFFRFPSLFSAYSMFLFCLLAALATSDLDNLRTTLATAARRRFFLITALAAASAVSCYLSVLRAVHLTFSGAGRPSVLLLVFWIAVPVTFLLWWKEKLTGGLFVTALVLIAILDAGSTFALSTATMYSPATVGWWNVMRSQHVKSLDLTPHGLARHMFPPDNLASFYRHNRNIAIRYATFANASDLRNQYVPPYETDPILSELAVGARRIWFSDEPLWLSLGDDAFAKYVKVSHELGVPPLVLQSAPRERPTSASASSILGPSGEDAPRPAKPLSPANIELVAYQPNALAFHYQADHDGWLLVSDRWAPDWVAEVNGRPVTVFLANFIFRGIAVTRGDNIIRFEYKPHGYLALVIASWGVVLLAACGEIVRFVTFRSRARVPGQA